MRKTIWILALSIAGFTAPAPAAESGIGFKGNGSTANPLSPKADGLKNLFSAEKFDMQQQVGISFGTGANRFSQYYLNTMTYKVSEPLTIQATLGVQNQSLGSGAYGNAGGARVVVPNVGVLYQPRPNLRIQFSFSNTPYYGSAYDPFWGRRGY